MICKLRTNNFRNMPEAMQHAAPLRKEVTLFQKGEGNMIEWKDWHLTWDGAPAAMQFDNGSVWLDIVGDVPDGYDWELLLQEPDGGLDILPLTARPGGVGVLLKRENLPKGGTYTLQVRGTLQADGVTQRHSTVAEVLVPESLSGDTAWPEIPAAFRQLEARLKELAAHPPKPGADGYWLLWDADGGTYQSSRLPVGTGGPKGDKGDPGTPGPAYTPGANISISGSVISTQAAPCNPNLLRNWYFLRPVNQRDVSGAISTAGYFLDGWKLVSGAVTIGTDGITLNGTMTQVLEHAPAGTVTASVLTPEGVGKVVPVYDGTAKTFTITAAGKKLLAAKLELGSVQTLAHQDSSGAWVLNEIPDYAEQLAACQRQLIPLSSYQCPAARLGTNEILFFVPLPVTMRTLPTINQNGFQVLSKTGEAQTGFTFSVSSLRSNGVIINASKTGHGMTDAVLNAGTLSLLSAEL